MGQWLEYKPGGIVEKNVLDEDNDILHVHKSEDVQPLLDRNAELRNTGATNIGIKKGFWHLCSIPVTIQYELLTKYKLSVCNKHHFEEIGRIIQREYPYLMTSTKRHFGKPSKQKSAETPKRHGPSVIVR